ncbi:MAG TPA: PIG-L family deacetylase [Tepidisphaeraceae bacterium]|nr:PIG-L family deacetylase [Tepidisphaeraceae bacterium]
MTPSPPAPVFSSTSAGPSVRSPRRSIGGAIVRRLRRILRPLLIPLRDWQAPRLHHWMMHEASLPMTLSHKSALIVAPHHDDETFGCGGLIALKRQAGVEVRIVIVTDGRQSHSHIEGLDGDQLMRTRKDEALRAAALLGVSPRDVLFLDLPDQGLTHLEESLRRRGILQIAELLRAFDPGELYMNHPLDCHPDHEAVYRLIDAASAQAGVAPDVYCYPIWLLWKGEFRLSLHPSELAGALRLDVRSVQAVKDQAIGVYISQMPVLPKGFVNQFQQGYEVFFRK